MPKGEKRQRAVEAFIRLTEETPEQIIWATKIIERIGGAPRYLYPPGIIIASIPAEGVRTLRTNALIASVDLTEIEAGRIAQASSDIAFAMAAWNKHLRRQRPVLSETAKSPGSRKKRDARQVKGVSPKRKSISSLPEG